MTTLQFSTDQRHAATLELLAEVREFLMRWPPHALTREMLTRIDDHLADPTHKLVHRSPRSGCSKTAHQFFTVSLLLEGDTATIGMRAGKDVAPETIIESLNQGLTIELQTGGKHL